LRIYKIITSQKKIPCGGCIRGSPPIKILAWNALATLTMWQEIKVYVIYKVVSFN
jgi:hypothetical protein